MDEIDAALDDTYRDKLSFLIGKLANKGYQVICTTHWPQLLNFANRIFHVENSAGFSMVKLVNKDKANYLIGYDAVDD